MDNSELDRASQELDEKLDAYQKQIEEIWKAEPVETGPDRWLTVAVVLCLLLVVVLLIIVMVGGQAI